MPRDLNLRASDRASGALVCASALTLACAAISLLFPELFASIVASARITLALLFITTALMLFVVLLLNLPLLGFLRARRGLAFASASFWLHALYYLYSAAAFAFCYCERASKSARTRAPAARRADAHGRVEDA